MLFVTCLTQQNLSYVTIQVYLSAVRYSDITSAKTTTLWTLRLNYILKGIYKESAVNHHSRERRPIPFPIMECLHIVLSQHSGNYNNTMIWVACCMAYLDSLEFTNSPHHPRPFSPTTDLLPYSGNLLREKIFANLAILLLEEIFAIFEFNC